MPSVPVLLREAKEPVDSRRPYLKSLTKEEGKKGNARKRKSRKMRKSQSAKRKKVRQERSSKSSPQDTVPSRMGTQY